MVKVKLMAIALLALFTTVVILQNSEDVVTKILFFTITLPHSVLLGGTVLVNFVTGVLFALLAQRRPGK